jgi:nitroimidazol reductase NimA-like FMN-containing flavoprotein (pyridoxamine 5'-phosphate oxidase superfamily)
MMQYRPMRRKKNEITDPLQMREIIRNSPVMRLAMCMGGEPYVVPLSFGCDGENIYFHCAPEGLKLDILRHNPRVCCLFEHDAVFEPKGDSPCAWGFAYSTAIVHGEAAPVTDHADKLAALQIITDHYAANGERVPADKVEKVEVWKIGILKMTGKQAL